LYGKCETSCFPVPVCADANTSLPSKMGGIAFVVLGKELYILLLMAFKDQISPNRLNDINMFMKQMSILLLL
jgi:hypothetical protein